MASVLGGIKAIGSDAVKVGDDVVHVVEEIGVGTAEAVKFIATAKEFTPEVKAGFATLFADGEKVAASFVTAGSNPTNFVADAAAVASLQQFVKDFVAFLPTIKTAVQAFEADTK